MTVATAEKRPLEWTTILFILGLHLGALCVLFPSNFSWYAVALALFMHWFTGCLGITLGWHRLISHRSFQVPKWLEYFFVFCGSLSCQSGPIEWIGLHRHHHAYSDQEEDHHNSNKGFWWSHMNWMWVDVPARKQLPRFTRDIASDPVYLFFDKYFIPLQFAVGIIFFIASDAIVGNGWSFVVWGVFLRIVLLYHCTWFVNSATHKFGYRTHETTDNSRNCWWVALLTYGEGWHNNHHAFQYSARHGWQWWEIDITWLTIRLLERLGLATKVKLISEA
ncbi:acyl-CoA desaturase [Prochlorothrix hollandica]|uniref:Acyl-CoA desaturase n=2 Tax=Prochlorothrix hollandica TaxID=1223 RepID=A0A0M2PXG8_PROHO|nr:acyl-lipid delta-9 desaturase [Prochlorothrix hollandica]KKJ01131.1 acyl-CoA desaturase [Prochlorothrix hollandica PCC 9006 = CALU 1027]